MMIMVMVMTSWHGGQVLESIWPVDYIFLGFNYNYFFSKFYLGPPTPLLLMVGGMSSLSSLLHDPATFHAHTPDSPSTSW